MTSEMATEAVADGRASVLERMTAKIERQKGLGYKFALVYVTPEEHETELRTSTLESLLDGTIRFHPSQGSDATKLERGDTDHMFFMAVFGDMYGFEAERAARAEKIAAADAKIRLKAEALAAKLARAEARAAKRDARASEKMAKAKAKAAAKRKKAKLESAKQNAKNKASKSA